MSGNNCASCGGAALANLQGRWFCAPCGLDETARLANRRAGVETSRRRSLRRSAAALVGSGLAAKILIGAAAVAAVGGVLVTDPNLADLSPAPTAVPTASPAPEISESPPAASADQDTPMTPHQAAGPTLEPAQAGRLPDDVAMFVSDIQSWADCVSEQAQLFAASSPAAGQGFDPGVCGDRPQPPEAGPAGVGPSEQASRNDPGQGTSPLSDSDIPGKGASISKPGGNPGK